MEFNGRGHRVVEGLEEVRLCVAPERFAKRKSRRGARAQGVAFEKLVVRRLGRAELRGESYAGQWLSFRDAHGWGFAQPDFFLVRPGVVLLLEVKLTLTDSGWTQMEQLYCPLLEKLYERPVTTVQVCKNLRGFKPEGLVEGLARFGEKHMPGRWVWHTLDGETVDEY